MPTKKPASRTKSRSTSRAKVVTNRQTKGLAALFRSKMTTAVVVAVFAVVGVGTVAWARAATTTYSLWPTSTVPKVITDSDSKSVELGVRFRATYSGEVLGVRFYKGPQNTGVHVGNLWAADGTKLASVTFKNETASGWQTAHFDRPVAIASNTIYVVSYFAPNGKYSANNDYFTSARKSGPLTAPRANNGVYKYGSTSSFPRDTYRASNYWVDVIFQTKRFTPSPAPAAPTDLKASVAETTVTLTWAPSPTTGVVRHEVLRDGRLVGSGTSNNSYIDVGLEPGSSYSYQVRAVDGGGQMSSLTGAVSVKIPATAPAPEPSPTPTPTPTPPPVSGGMNCATKPSACGYRDATNTGWQHTGVTLKTVTGSANGTYYVEQEGAVIDGLDIRACVYVRAKNVTIKRSKITCSNQPMIKHWEPDGKGGLVFIGQGLVVEDVEFDGRGDPDANGISFDHYTVRRSHFHHLGHALKLGSNVVVEDNYVSDISYTTQSHNGGFPSDGGRGITIRHNTVFMNSPNGYAIASYNWIPAGTVVADVLIENNLLAGGNYILYCGAPGNITPNLRVINNRFSNIFYAKGGNYGPTANCGGAATWSGNVWDHTLAPLNP